MLQSIKGVYKDGAIKLAETPENIEESQVIVTFLEPKSKKQTKQIIGTSGQQLLRFVGEIVLEDLQLMSEAIEEHCEQIDLNEW
ncbi:hypothetical protein Sta7437_1305 [Stanieria cyanosphaera PCC 7437]|uniref:DUF104 domain-containing protein n=1 Tax=Stanieria cyanosphaera (strain ATCC 29371 / PCC 7437) TaxID=111780 RepID=K9XQS1_STAC7|nr:hypothetical protein [Stanieria cyanosphaera]AFZ34873.1 hypothetical protein Sta7437_1305 [Stanieria cyanosphaera PCC 7437]